jgi:hypothetical protein
MSGGHSFSVSELGAEVCTASHQVEVVVLTPKTTLVPAELFDKAHAADYLIEMGLSPAADECAVYSAAVNGAIAVMAINKQCCKELNETIAAGVTFTSPLLVGSNIEKGSAIHLEGEVLYVSLYDGGLRFAEAFECKTDADVLYYVAKVEEVYGIYNMYARAKGDVKRLQKLLKPIFKNLVCE